MADFNHPDEVSDPDTAIVRANFQELDKRTKGMSASYAGFTVGELLAVNNGRNGLALASDISKLFCGLRPLGGYVPDMIRQNGSVTLNTKNHAGRLLLMQNTSSATVGVEFSGDPASGVQDAFATTVLRAGSGTVTITSTSMTIIQSQRKIISGQGCSIVVDGSALRIFLLGSVEA